MVIVTCLMARRVAHDWMNRSRCNWVPNLSKLSCPKVSQLLKFSTHANTYLSSAESDILDGGGFRVKFIVSS